MNSDLYKPVLSQTQSEVRLSVTILTGFNVNYYKYVTAFATQIVKCCALTIQTYTDRQEGGSGGA